MPYRNKTYVAFDADTDWNYYLTMKMWKAHPNISFNFYNAHDANDIREWSQEESKKRQLRERMLNSKLFILIIGKNTKFLYKYVRWEIELALEMGIPIICANINGCRRFDENLCPPVLKNKLALHISFGLKPICKAIEIWTQNRHNKLLGKGKIQARWLTDQAYRDMDM
jgi:hypothetical protein